MEKLFKFEKDTNIWSILYKNVPIWSYMRGAFYGQFLPYMPSFYLTFRDFKGFIVFLSLFWRKDKVVIFVSGRKDLIDYALTVASKKFNNKHILLFTRSEKGLAGNVFLIEVIRFIFRKISWFFVYFSYTKKLKEIERKVGVSNKKLLKDLIGDYYFNYFLFAFLRKVKVVLYSNAVIPRVERYMNLYNSIELQHGVVHKEHLDYVNVPYISNKFFCYSNLVKIDLERWGFSGKVEVVEKVKTSANIKYKVAIFGTVDPNYSKIIEELCEKYNNIYIKLHPRDSYQYKDKLQKLCVKTLSPLEVEIPILPDSSLISDCFLNNKFFIYLTLNSYSKEENKEYI
ncbi:hypothetical protein OIN80_17680, partial [Acinetobacter baumannii]|nr:hypothetical protein [Acinetobacter baumannii]